MHYLQIAFERNQCLCTRGLTLSDTNTSSSGSVCDRLFIEQIILSKWLTDENTTIKHNYSKAQYNKSSGIPKSRWFKENSHSGLIQSIINIAFSSKGHAVTNNTVPP